MPDRPVLRVQGVGKRLARDHAVARRLGLSAIARDLRGGPGARRRPLHAGEFWALRDVSFDVAPGEAVAVIGANGAGKSTLLRILHGLSRPDTGTVAIRGSRAALLDLGVPFNAVLTGRENVETAAAVHGVDRDDLPDLMARVSEFAELDDVLDAPMRTYSTGMQLRLGYAIAAQLRPNLLIVDEVVAVGDIAFQRKCVQHVRSHLARGGALVLVSHDLWMVQALCDRCLVLGEGRVVLQDTPNHAISAYLREMRRAVAPYIPRDHGAPPTSARGSDPVPVAVTRAASARGGVLCRGDRLEIEVTCAPAPEEPTVRWELDIVTASRQVCIARLAPEDDTRLRLEGTVLSLALPDLALLPGSYGLTARLVDPETGEVLGETSDPHPIEVGSRGARLDTLVQLPGAGALTSLPGRYSVVTTGPSPAAR